MKAMIGDGAGKAPQTVAQRIILVVLVAASILLVPLVAMQFTNEVAWTLSDFAAAGALLVGTGLGYVLLERKVSNIRYRSVGGVALAVALLLVWAELAVGIIGN